MSSYLDIVLNLVAVISLAVCWGAFALTWLAGAIFYEPRAPAERTRSWFGSTKPVGVAIAVVVWVAVPRTDWSSLVVHAPWVRLLGLVILLAATAGFPTTIAATASRCRSWCPVCAW